MFLFLNITHEHYVNELDVAIMYYFEIFQNI